ncbi:MAG: LOW QUALITY PROTEIN: hypothetical protein BJ554DRAFT_4046 [Olpidium bornovanus]|uniref:Uncharacterized protein n=1 Tax=Olpidium bornovanus TaxID=278681 RepID=A0A8H8DFI1_9FUNG|nr:MAG: LOW QUALITY PROTEIN: hypothetical protein BJ554DRAFT_4046 [Olpidium bornovanus]
MRKPPVQVQASGVVRAKQREPLAPAEQHVQIVVKVVIPDDVPLSSPAGTAPNLERLLRTAEGTQRFKRLDQKAFPAERNGRTHHSTRALSTAARLSCPRRLHPLRRPAAPRPDTASSAFALHFDGNVAGPVLQLVEGPPRWRLPQQLARRSRIAGGRSQHARRPRGDITAVEVLWRDAADGDARGHPSRRRAEALAVVPEPRPSWHGVGGRARGAVPSSSSRRAGAQAAPRAAGAASIPSSRSHISSPGSRGGLFGLMGARLVVCPTSGQSCRPGVHSGSVSPAWAGAPGFACSVVQPVPVPRCSMPCATPVPPQARAWQHRPAGGERPRHGAAAAAVGLARWASSTNLAPPEGLQGW